MTKATLFTWQTPYYIINLASVSSTPMNNGTTATIQSFYDTVTMVISAGYGKYLAASSPNWMKIWNKTRNEYLWGRRGTGDYISMLAAIPGTWQVGDEITNAVDGAASAYAEIWIPSLPSAAIATEATITVVDSTPSTTVIGIVNDINNLSYLYAYPLHATIATTSQGLCKITNSKLRYRIAASGANTFKYQLRLLGYYTEVDVIPPTTSRVVSPKGVRIA